MTPALAVTGSGLAYSLGFVLCVAFILRAWRRRQLRGGLPLPPGPPGLPLVENTFDLNPIYPWLTYERWGKQYGPVVYANLIGKDFIILNNTEVVHDLLDRRSSIYSDRLSLPVYELFGMDFVSPFIPYGDRWRCHRRLFTMALGKTRSEQYRPMAFRKAHQLVKNLLEAPERFSEHCGHFAAATIMAVTYGYEVAPMNDPFVTRIEHFIDLLREAVMPSRAALLMAFPFLVHIPSWLPGGRYKLRAPESRALAREVLTSHVDYVVERMNAGTAGESFVRDLLEQQHNKMDRDTIQDVATSMFLGGVETTDSMLRLFILTMVLHPEVQAKAQEEIDRVVGSGRLPDFSDHPNLPYIEALQLELHRWRPTLPLAIPHVTSESDVYKGMYIPKGAMVLPNIWAIAHDETRYHNPTAFLPERHLTPAGTVAEHGATHYSFGFGRRICAGRFVAEQNVWAAAVTILATMHIAKPRDELGNEIDVNPEFTNHLTSVPKPFVCSITPRSVNAENLIRARHAKES